MEIGLKGFKFLAVLIAVIKVTRSTKYICPIRSSEPIRAHGTKCYEFVVHRKLTWSEARTNCHRQGGRLATIENSGVQSFLYHSLRSIGYGGVGVWIGLTDAAHEGTFKWDSGQPVTYTYWAKGQPDLGAAFEDCTLFKMSGGNNGHWHDDVCEGVLFVKENHEYICEFRMIPITFTSTSTVRTPATTTKTTTVPTKPTEITTSIKPTTKLTTVPITTNLATTSTPNVHTAVTTETTSAVPRSTTGTTTSTKLKFSTASATSLRTSTVHTISITDATTEEQNRSTAAPFTIMKTTPNIVHHCATGWVENQNYCFYFSDTIGTWYDVSNYCKAFGAILAEPTDQESQLLLRNIVQSKAKGPIGFFVGGTDTFNEGSWVWVSTMTQFNTHNMTYKDTDAGDNEDSDCLILRSDGYFTDHPCLSKLPYICQRR